jgi:hypothetical protein
MKHETQDLSEQNAFEATPNRFKKRPPQLQTPAAWDQTANNGEKKQLENQI